jgi:ParB-like chromosome segregation protein Spo0J
VKVIEIPPEQLDLSDELRRSGSAKQFEDRLRSSIEEIGLAEPIKVASMPSGRYLVVDGTMRTRAIWAIREADPEAFRTVPAYVTDYERRFEIRYQTDIYQDLLPSQLATLVEHLHKAEGVRKVDIARYIGVSPATLRNYTGLWRLLQRGGLAARIVELMDVGVIPSSNPYAWLRLKDKGLRRVLEENLTEGEPAEKWIEQTVLATRQGQAARYITSYIESITGSLDDEYYLADEDVRSVKRDLGLRRAAGQVDDAPALPLDVNRDVTAAVRHLNQVARQSTNPVLKAAAKSFKAYLQ